MSAIPSEYRTDNLFVLVGTNPLPNLVATRLLLKPRGTVYFVHSDTTKDVAIRLINLAARRGFANTCRVAIRSGDPDTIFAEVKRVAVEAIKEGSIGLNYTGGTKVMSVYAFRAIETAAGEADIPAVHSYLDANDLSMVIDPLGTAKGQRFPVSLAVQPSLTDLLYLHKIQLMPGRPLKQAFFPGTAHALATVHSTKEGIAAWAEWCQQLRREDRPDKWKSTGGLREIRLPVDGVLADVSSALREETGLGAGFTLGDLKPKSPWADNRSRDAMEAIAKWLDGVWLEHYTYTQLQEIAGAQHLHPEGMGIGLDTDKTKSPYDFEVDVAVMRGYQLFALSCTRDCSNSLCKSKLLEVYVRASQLGGEEARVGLVSCHSDPAIVQKEAEDAWRAQKRVRVFGYKDLTCLSKRLAQWFETTS